MNYKGKLYGRISKRGYLPLKMTSDDVDKLEAENKAQAEMIVKLRDQLTKAIEKIQPAIKP
jgi:hypothetical protein